MPSSLLRRFCSLDIEAAEVLRHAMEELQLSARAYDRILKVARTIADLAASESIRPAHILEAIGYRTLDRTLWR
jgi:magnesium chelatase family protein